MKKFSYIDTVLSHIADRQKRNKIESELFDHLDEKEQRLEKIGYGEAEAFEKANEAMGDGDTVGEQLDMIKKPFFSRHIGTLLGALALAAAVISYALLFRSNIRGSFSIVTNARFFVFSISYFWSFVMFSAVFVLGAVAMAAGTKSKSFFALCSGFAVAESVLLIGPYHYCDIIKTFFSGGHVTNIFYSYSAFDNILFRFRGADAAICCIFSALMLGVFTACLVLLIRIKRLKNTRRDLTVKNILIYTLCAAAAITAVLTAVIFINTVNERDYRAQKTASLLLEEESEFVSSIDDFVECGTFEKFTDNTEKYAEKFEMEFDYNNSHRGQIDAVKDGTSFYAYSEAEQGGENDALSSYYFVIEHSLFDPLSFSNRAFELYNADNIENVKSLSDVPLPAHIDLNYSKESGVQLEFSYDSDELLRFEYDEKQKKFRLIYNSENDEYESVSLTNEQITEFETALKEYDENGSSNKRLWLQIHGAYYNSSYDAYTLEYSYGYYVNNYWANSIEASTSDYELTFGCKSPVKFSDGKAEIMWDESVLGDTVEGGTGYENTSDLLDDVKDYYSTESKNQILAEHLIENFSMIIYNYDINRYALKLENYAVISGYDNYAESQTDIDFSIFNFSRKNNSE